MYNAINETAEWLLQHLPHPPKTAIILGTGLGDFVNDIADKTILPYSEIPHFPVSTVEGHSGKLIYGKLGNVDILAMQGRFHYYEGYSMSEVTFPIRVFKAIGIKTLFVSNAAGGMRADFQKGDLMIIADHINHFPEHPLRGKNDNRLGTRFPDMSEAYSIRLRKKAIEIAKKMGIKVTEGVYLGTSGPTYETPAEYRYFKLMGADAVGMSTVPEVIVARHAGLEVFAISVITDLGVDGKIEEVTHTDVQNAALIAQPNMTTLFRTLINETEA
jgi:purine-nucleoside phosphorylase